LDCFFFFFQKKTSIKKLNETAHFQTSMIVVHLKMNTKLEDDHRYSRSIKVTDIKKVKNKNSSPIFKCAPTNI